MRNVVFGGAAFAVMVAGAASAKPAKPPLPPFEATTQCMLGVLQTEPHVRDAKFVGMSWARSSFVDDNGEAETRPYFQYVFEEGNGRSVTVRFHRVDEHGPLWFQAGLSGLSTPGTNPPDYGTSHIATRWTNECHVEATVLYN